MRLRPALLSLAASATLSCADPATTVQVAVPPELLAPPPGAVLDNSCVDRSDVTEWDFDWSDVPGASGYRLVVQHRDASVAALDVVALLSAYHARDRSYIVDRNRLGWRWKVQSYVAGTWSEFSADRGFDVEPIDTDCRR